MGLRKAKCLVQEGAGAGRACGEVMAWCDDVPRWCGFVVTIGSGYSGAKASQGCLTTKATKRWGLGFSIGSSTVSMMEAPVR